MTSLKANLWKIYLYNFLSEFYLVIPILIPYYQAHNLSPTQIFTIQAAYAFSVLLFEIPSGYLADVIGRKKTLVIGAIALPLGISVYALTNSFITFILAEFVVALGNSMRSGSYSALIYDSLIQMSREAEYKKYEGRTFFYTRIGTSASSILGALFALFSLHLPFYINIVTAAFMLPIALSLAEPARKKLEGKNPLKNIVRISRFSLSHPRLRLYILYAALLMSTGVVGVWGYFLYYDSLGIPLVYFGLIFAIFQIASGFGSRYAHSLEKRLGEKRALALMLLTGPVFILLGTFKSIWMLPLIYLNAFLWGLAFPLILDSMNRVIPSETRATVLSVSQMSCSLSFVILSPLFGKLVEILNLSRAFGLLGIYFLIYATLVLSRLFQHIQASSD